METKENERSASVKKERMYKLTYFFEGVKFDHVYTYQDAMTAIDIYLRYTELKGRRPTLTVTQLGTD